MSIVAKLIEERPSNHRRFDTIFGVNIESFNSFSLCIFVDFIIHDALNVFLDITSPSNVSKVDA